MKKETYIKLMDYIRGRKVLKDLIEILYTALPFVMVVMYPTIVILNGIRGFDYKFALSIIVPGVTLAGVYFMRKLINRQRPYEKFGTDSLIAKNKKGQSFPSNHSACGFVIAMTGFSLSPILGCGLLFIAFIIALTRIFSGVHFISDVIAGILIGASAGSVFIFI